jgi:ubiquinone/menaquinone biosynthesis C-methylase UbiE
MKQWLRSFYFSVPPSWRLGLRRVYYLPIDIIEGITGKRNALTPPKGLIFTGSGDFIKQGQVFLQHFKKLGGLTPEQAVLDVGSGMGRMAVPLTQYLNSKGSYEGFDIMPDAVKWCNQHISKEFPNFNFKCVALSNSLYTNSGDESASFTFPYNDSQFDFVFLTSVFTHMMPADVTQYLNEINRVLKPNGKCFATFFYLDNKAIEFMTNQEKPFFPHPFPNYYLHNLKVPEANIGFTPEYFHAALLPTQLQIEHIYPGWWSSRPKSESGDFQDIIIFKREAKL